MIRKGDKPITVTWYLDGHPVLDSENVQILKVGRSSILTIDPVGGHDQGNYTCKASNPAGQASSVTSLIVHGSGISSFLLVNSHF